MLERLQKIIARAGVASRRHAEEMISSGLVTVNGQTVTELGTKADASKDHIKVSGKLLRSESKHLYLILNKPPEIVSTMSDPEGRASLSDFLHGTSERVFPVGRLEYHSGGLIFLTNDGDLANRMLRAHQLRQTYQLKLKTLLSFAEIESLGRTFASRISRLRGNDAPWYEVTLSDARRDALRSRLFQTGHYVEKMTRVSVGNLSLGPLPRGQYRELSPAEVSGLSRSIDDSVAGRTAPLEKSTLRRAKAGYTKSKHGKPAREKSAHMKSASERPMRDQPGRGKSASRKPFMRERKEPFRKR